MTAQQHLPPLRIAQQCADASPIDRYFDRFKPFNGFIGQDPGMINVADPQVATQSKPLCQPGQSQDRQQ
jgi:hypothetical protein